MSIFISYSSKDVIYAQKIVDLLRANGEDVWFAVDSIGIGENYAESIVKAMEKSDKMIMLLSKHSIESKHVKIELNLALDNNVTIYPIRLEDILPDSNMKYYFITSQWSDLFYDDFHRLVDGFVEKIFPNKNTEIKTKKALHSVKVESDEAKMDIVSTFTVEDFIPEEYGEKSFFETDEEFIKRNLDYNYVAVSKFDLIGNNYDIQENVFTLHLDDAIPFDSINIKPEEAKALFKDTNNRQVYQKFFLENNVLVKKYYVILGESTYELTVSKEAQRKIDFQVLFEWANKFDISESVFPRNIADLTNITHLDLFGNKITEVPSELALLTNLTTLNLGNNHIEKMPKELTTLKELTIIDQRIIEKKDESAKFFDEITLDELTDRVSKKMNFTVIIEETRGSVFDIVEDPKLIIGHLVKRISTFDLVEGDIVSFINTNKLSAKIELGLVTKDKPQIMYWEDGKPKFSFYVDDALEIFK
ncbi:TIR domain-containing protein [Sulfurimonas aquatica]|uniref:TIR domain-containing protein n=1 Tax=Sulfurimonas aquatica TaxID=2672570 RepID=A0A975B0W8_9BACT|nr:toll/interleukin-1 receptor domain-containing protein [Sulfurimonas aquatica]QSZ42199.1 TIR domain-containing protein [Sulfurimonas aquatica]